MEVQFLDGDDFSNTPTQSPSSSQYLSPFPLEPVERGLLGLLVLHLAGPGNLVEAVGVDGAGLFRDWPLTEGARVVRQELPRDRTHAPERPPLNSLKQ